MRPTVSLWAQADRLGRREHQGHRQFLALGRMGPNSAPRSKAPLPFIKMGHWCRAVTDAQGRLTPVSVTGRGTQCTGLGQEGPTSLRSEGGGLSPALCSVHGHST